MYVLGIETSCDETAAAIIDGSGRVCAHTILSQLDEHMPYGGVVPEIAARAHLDYLDGIIKGAMEEADLDFSDLDGVAATAGPGLIGGVIVGAMTAKAIALACGLPFIAVNHLEAHALTVRLTHSVDFPYLLLLVSGGHCQLLICEGVGRFVRLGTTMDDAVGETFDKTAKLMGLGYPGGPAIEELAKTGDPVRFDLPRPMVGRKGCDFSFSGLKTAVRRIVDGLPIGPIPLQTAADLAAGLQAAIGDCLVDRTKRAIDLFLARYPEGKTLVLAGGVAANAVLRARMTELAKRNGLAFAAPPLDLCTDNAAMVAWAGLERLRLGLTDPLDFKVRPRWPLDPDAPKRGGAGVKA
ncbi:MAG: tRNA (adenosine(37)-N6)-threonylcarbamoyltransferase complex transferase subunit TsaD [Pseudomonadota bacterium]|nr:tRNA (adenosine(37)-N6)-threonylcarbamoyltransferase complex transferase subunit TsaD [Pseudomonadota bacterium]